MVNPSNIRILSVDDHPLFREAIATVIENQPDMVLVAEAATGGEGLQRFREQEPDVTLMGFRLPDSSGIEAMLAIRSQFPDARVILTLTIESDSDATRGLQAGAYACIFKTTTPREMVTMIREVYERKRDYTLGQSTCVTASGG